MHKQSIHILKTLLVLLASVLFAGCFGPPAKMIPSITSFSVDGKPIIQPRLGKILIVPFSKDKFIDADKFDAYGLFCPYLQEEFKDNLETLLRTPGLFGYSDKYVINVKAELVSMRNPSGASTNKYEGTMKYEFSTKNGTILLTEKIISQGNDNTFNGFQRITNVCHNTGLNNIALLSKVLKSKLPNVWQAYAEKQETVRRKIAANLKKENRYFRVLESSATIREQPDVDAREMIKLPQDSLVHVTGSLPSGWLRVSREGKPLGWVYASLLREDFASAPSYRPEEPPMVPASLPAAPASVDVASLDFGSYHALVVGNNDYRSFPNLRTAVNDARAMAGLLQDKYGFSVRLLTNATRTDILKAISGYRRTLTRRDNLVIYYAGHGWLDKDADEGYWLPVDATEEDSTYWISNSSITTALRAMQAKHVLVVADSCYSGKLARGIKINMRARNYYERIWRKKARTVMASGGLEPVADEGGKGRHSVFASALIEALNENQGVLDTTLLFSKIRRPVMVNTDQTPEYSDIRKAGHDGGDFLFVRQKR